MKRNHWIIKYMVSLLDFRRRPMVINLVPHSDATPPGGLGLWFMLNVLWVIRFRALLCTCLPAMPARKHNYQMNPRVSLAESRLRRYWKNGGKMAKMVKMNHISEHRLMARSLGGPWTGRMGSAPVQMSRCCLGTALSWLCDGLLRGLVVPRRPFVSPWIVTLVILGLGLLRAHLLGLCCTAVFPLIFLQLRKGPLWSCAGLLQSYALCSSDQCGTVKPRLPAVRGLFWMMIALITCNSSLVPLFEGLCNSNPCRFGFSVF